MQAVGSSILIWRTSKKLTQEELSKLSGVSRPNLSAIEQGARDVTVGTLRRIASALGISAGTLVDGISPQASLGKQTLSREAVDRIGRLAAGQKLKAIPEEIQLAEELASIMKAKTGMDVKSSSRTERAQNTTMIRLKSELGTDIFNHLIKRVEKHIALLEK